MRWPILSLDASEDQRSMRTTATSSQETRPAAGPPASPASQDRRAALRPLLETARIVEPPYAFRCRHELPRSTTLPPARQHPLCRTDPTPTIEHAARRGEM